MRRLQAIKGGLLVIDRDLELRNAHLALDLEINHARNLVETLAHLLGEGAQRIEVIAEDLDGNLGTHA